MNRLIYSEEIWFALWPLTENDKGEAEDAHLAGAHCWRANGKRGNRAIVISTGAARYKLQMLTSPRVSLDWVVNADYRIPNDDDLMELYLRFC